MEVDAPCPFCGRQASVIGGLCTNCGRLRDPHHAKPPRKYDFSTGFWEYDNPFMWALFAFAAGLVRAALHFSGAWKF